MSKKKDNSIKTFMKEQLKPKPTKSKTRDHKAIKKDKDNAKTD
jgi:hypothetical protein